MNQADVDAGRREGLTTEERTELRELRKENLRLREERGDPEKSRGLCRTGDRAEVAAVHRFIRAERANHSVADLCRILGVSRAGFYAARGRPPSRRALEDARIRGDPRDPRPLARHLRCSPRARDARPLRHPRRAKRVTRLMRREEVSGLIRRKRGRTTIRVPGVATTPDLVRREWNPSEPNRLWVADITYCRTWEGWLYLAAVLDCYSRRCMGWSIRDDLRAELVSDAMAMAIAARRPDDGLIHHSDRGSQYVSLALGRRCREGGDLRVDRGLLQRPETAYHTELCESPGVRGYIYKSTEKAA